MHSPFFPAEGSSEAVRAGEVGGLRGELGAVTGEKSKKTYVGILKKSRHGCMQTDTFRSCCYRKKIAGSDQHYYCFYSFVNELVLCLLLHAFLIYEPILI